MWLQLTYTQHTHVRACPELAPYRMYPNTTDLHMNRGLSLRWVWRPRTVYQSRGQHMHYITDLVICTLKLLQLRILYRQLHCVIVNP